jgi:hypothetical protein
MYTGRLVFSQLMDFVPLQQFRRCVNRHHGNRYTKSFSCLDQFLCMSFAQLSYRESLRDIESCLRAKQNKLYHMGTRSKVSRSTLAVYVLLFLVINRGPGHEFKSLVQGYQSSSKIRFGFLPFLGCWSFTAG